MPLCRFIANVVPFAHPVVENQSPFSRAEQSKRKSAGRPRIQGYRMPRASDVGPNHQDAPFAAVPPFNVKRYRGSLDGARMWGPLADFNAIANRACPLVHYLRLDLVFWLKSFGWHADFYLGKCNCTQEQCDGNNQCSPNTMHRTILTLALSSLPQRLARQVISGIPSRRESAVTRVSLSTFAVLAKKRSAGSL